MFGSFQRRLTLFFGALFFAVQAIAFVTVRDAIVDNIVARSRQQLSRALTSFNLEIQETATVLRGWSAILAADFGFRQAIASDDQLTVRSAVNNIGRRMDADRIILVTLDGGILTDTGSAEDAPRGDIVTLGGRGTAFKFTDLIAAADADGQASAFVVMDQVLYQIVIAPVLAPVPIAWIVIASEIQNTYAAQLAGHVSAQIDLSFATETPPGAWAILATTLQGERPNQLIAAIPALPVGQDIPVTMRMGPDDYAAMATRLPGSTAAPPVIAVLQFAIDGALRPFGSMFELLIALAGGFLVATLAGAALIARGLARPIERLDHAARRIAAGDYGDKVPVGPQNELGRLSETFNLMMDGIAERELRIEHQALHDAATGLPNRLSFERHLGHAIAMAEQSRGRLSVYLVQIGRFAEINHTFGHNVGDELIRELSLMLRRIIKQGDVVARHSTNMFALLLPGAGLNAVDPIVQRILDQIEDPVGVAGHAIDVTAWIGEACYPEHGTDARTLLQRADTAIFEAKRSARRFAVYDPAQDPHKPEQLSAMGELRAGIDRGEFKLFYQPKIDLKTERVVAAEALIRWFHPKRGPISPDDFIPLAEQTGNIHKVTAWVLQTAIAQAGVWKKNGHAIKIAINLSARDLNGRRLPEDVGNLLTTHGVAAGDIIMELTESAVMSDPGQSIEVLAALNKMGLGLAIDDYGIGYSSMSYLRRLPVQELKIDKSFVVKLASSSSDQIIVKSTIDLGHNLGLRVTGEGVEDLASLQILQGLGCETGQGYYISKPLAAADFERFMIESRWAPERT